MFLIRTYTIRSVIVAYQNFFQRNVLRIFLSVIYTISDDVIANSLTNSAVDSLFTIGSNAQVTHDSDGMKLYCSANGQGNESATNHVIFDTDLPSDFEVSFVFKNANQYACVNIDGLNLDWNGSNNNAELILWKITDNNWNTHTSTLEYITYNTGNTIKIVKQNGEYSIYVNDVLKTTVTYNSTYATGKFCLTSCCGTRWIQIKDLQIKQL